MLMDAKTLIGSPVDASGNYDGLLGDIIAGVLVSADEFMDVAYQQVTGHAVYFDGGERTIYLPHVNVSNVRVYENSVLIPTTEYGVYPERGVIKTDRGDRLRRGQRNIRVVYDGGYAEDQMPKSLRRKLLRQVSYEFRRRNDPGLSSVSAPDGSSQKFDIGEWLKDVEAELLRRRRICL